MFNYKYDCNNEIYEDKCENISNYEEYKNDCICGFDEYDLYDFPVNPMYGQTYVPMQRLNNIFVPIVGLKMGTIFPELYSKYNPGQSIIENNIIKEENKIGEGCNR